MTHSILHIDSSARRTDSVTRDLSARIVRQLGVSDVVTRDLAAGLPFVDETWVGANNTPKAERSAEQRDKLALSDELVAEIRAADTLVIGVPIYNFAAPASFKSWIDQIARVGETFQYGEQGPEGLLTGKRAIVAIASGGVPVGSDYDHTTPYIRFVLGFIGITDVTFVAADNIMAGETASLKAANDAIQALAAA